MPKYYLGFFLVVLRILLEFFLDSNSNFSSKIIKYIFIAPPPPCTTVFYLALILQQLSHSKPGVRIQAYCHSYQ